MSDLARYLAGGAAGRSDSISGLDPVMQNALAQFLSAAPGGLTINSAYRSPEVQAQLYQNALARYGSEAEARRWVAPPGHSQHNHGMAVDLGFADDAARQWAHDHAAEYGLSFPLGNENWHLELATARGAAPVNGVAGQAADPGRADQMPRQVRPSVPQQGAMPEQNRLAVYALDPGAFMARPMQLTPVDFTPRRRG